MGPGGHAPAVGMPGPAAELGGSWGAAQRASPPLSLLFGMSEMWKFLRQALGLLPRSVASVAATSIVIVTIAGGCLFVADFASGGVVPEELSAIASYLAGAKLITTIVVVTISVLLAFGLLIVRLAETRNKP